MSNGIDSRPYYDDNVYYSRPMYPSGASGGGSQREYVDRNWYLQPDDRQRYGDRNSPYDNRFDRYDDRYAPNRYQGQRPGGYGFYDRNGNDHNTNDYRGNGYDNRDPAFYNSIRQGGSGYDGGYDGNVEIRNFISTKLSILSSDFRSNGEPWIQLWRRRF